MQSCLKFQGYSLFLSPIQEIKNKFLKSKPLFFLQILLKDGYYYYCCYIFLLSVLVWIFWIYWPILFFRKRGREGEKEGGIHQSVVASHPPPTGDLAHNPGMCPDWESHRRPFGSQASAQSTKPHQPGHILTHSFPHSCFSHSVPFIYIPNSLQSLVIQWVCLRSKLSPFLFESVYI